MDASLPVVFEVSSKHSAMRLRLAPNMGSRDVVVGGEVALDGKTSELQTLVKAQGVPRELMNKCFSQKVEQ